MSTVRSEVASYLVGLRKGETFTSEDVQYHFDTNERKTARNRLAEFAKLGLVKRVSRGTYKVTSSTYERKRWTN